MTIAYNDKKHVYDDSTINIVLDIVIITLLRGFTQRLYCSTQYTPLPRKRSPDGATTDCRGGHLIAAYYSFSDLERMKG